MRTHAALIRSSPLALLLLAACTEVRGAGSDLDLAPDAPVVMIVADTLAASHLGTYGYELETSPHLDELAERAFVFDGHATQCNATFPSMTSILTGLYPRTHKSFLEVPLAEDALGVETRTIAERFQAKGYYTIAIWSHPFWLEESAASVSRGWDHHSVIGSTVAVAERSAHARGDYTNERLREALATYRREGEGRPLFLWLHYFDPHTPYDPAPADRNRFLRTHLAAVGMGRIADELAPVPLDERQDWLRRNVPDDGERLAAYQAMRRALYDGEIRTMDREIDTALGDLREAGLLEDALTLFLADHGENVSPAPSRSDIYFTHTRLFEDVVRTPLLIRFPYQERGRRIDALSQNIDVLPTLVDLLRLDPEPAVEGRSLVPLLLERAEHIHDQTFIESRDNVEKAVRTTRLKYIDPGAESEPLLFDLGADPGERDSIADRVAPEVVTGLEGLLDQFIPADVLRARFEPGWSTPRSLVLRVPLTPLGEVAGAARVAKNRHALRAVPAEPERPSELRAALSRLRSPLHFELAGVRPADVYLGRQPIARSTAIPVLAPSEESAPADAVFALRRDEAGRYALEVRPDAPARVEIELRFAQPLYGRRLELVEATGFEDLVRVTHGQSSYVLACDAGGPVRAVVESTHPEEELLVLARIDGAWPPLDRVAVQDRALDRTALAFTFPEPPDGRITAALLAGPPDEPPPGAVCLWMDGATQRVTVDKSQLDGDVLRELQKLGYAK